MKHTAIWRVQGVGVGGDVARGEGTGTTPTLPPKHSRKQKTGSLVCCLDLDNYPTQVDIIGCFVQQRMSLINNIH